MASFESIASSVITSSTSDVTFSNLSSSYDHFFVAFYYQASGSGNTNVNLRLNGDSSGNYNYLRSMVSSTGTSVSANTSETQFDIADVSGSSYNSVAVWILGAQTNKFKNMYSQGTTDGTSRVKMNFGQWASANTVTSITVFIGDAKNILNATVALYGIRNS